MPSNEPFDKEQFIEEVRKRPALYDVTCKAYAKKNNKMKLWADIGSVLFKDWSSQTLGTKEDRVKQLMKNWRSMRDTFVKYHKLVLKGDTATKPHAHYEQLQFLVDNIRGWSSHGGTTPKSSVRPKRAKSSRVEKDFVYDAEDSEDDEIDVESPEVVLEVEESKELKVDGGRHNRRASARNMKKEQTNSSMPQLVAVPRDHQQQQQSSAAQDIYGHRSFLMSFVPLMNALPLPLAMQAREDFSKIMRRMYEGSGTNGNNQQVVILDTADTSEYAML